MYITQYIILHYHYTLNQGIHGNSFSILLNKNMIYVHFTYKRDILYIFDLIWFIIFKGILITSHT